MWPSGGQTGHIQQISQSKHGGMPNPPLFSQTYATCIATWMELGGPGPALLSRCGRLHKFLYKGETGSKLIARCGRWKRTHTASEGHKAAMAAHTLASIAKQWGFHWGRGACRTAKALHKACLCARVHASMRHWRGCYGCRVEKASRVSFPLSGLLSQVVFN